MSRLFQLTIRSARLALWPAIILNTSMVAFAAGAPFSASLLLAVGLACVASYGFVINDCADVEVDAINGVERLARTTAEERNKIHALGKVLLGVGLGFSALVNISAVLLMAGTAGGLMIYTHFARRRLVWATLLASFLASAPLWLPNLAFGVRFNWMQILLVVAIMIFVMGRELIFDVQDCAGDKVGGRQTFAVRFGARATVSISLALHLAGAFLLLAVVGLEAETSNWSPLLFAGVVLFLALLLPAVWQLRTSLVTARQYARFTMLSRLAMFVIPLIWLVA